jgi:NAD(P)-dependent dehydrogenase (short-subunit alcohol dehydrogenase family)
MMAGTPPEFQQQIAALIPLGKMGDPTDIAAAALFLASDDSRHITGIDLPVDGGLAQV